MSNALNKRCSQQIRNTSGNAVSNQLYLQCQLHVQKHLLQTAPSCVVYFACTHLHSQLKFSIGEIIGRGEEPHTAIPLQRNLKQQTAGHTIKHK